MFSKQIVVAATLAAVQRATAQDTFTTDQLSGRIVPKLIGDPCHPRATWALGGTETIPPCISEQFVAITCEHITQALRDKENAFKMNAYRSCLFGDGSSYEMDVFGFLKCKAKHNIHSSAEDAFWNKYWEEAIAKFKKASPLQTGLWDVVAASTPWHLYPLRHERQIHGNFTIEQYYPDAPRSQNIGQFALNGTVYPKAAPQTSPASADAGPTVKIKVVFRMNDGGVLSISSEQDWNTFVSSIRENESGGSRRLNSSSSGHVNNR